MHLQRQNNKGEKTTALMLSLTSVMKSALLRVRSSSWTCG
jgi:hypothetical protein